jgi:glycosyltransferase involved in cell wall biosynthesis
VKVLFITTNYPTEKQPQFGIFVKEQKESLEALGVECDVFYSNGKENGGAKEHIKSIGRLFKYLLKNKYDVIHCHHVISGLILILSGGALFNKCILSYQNDPSREMGNFIFHFVYLFFNKIITKNKSKKYSRYKKVVYLPNGVNAAFFKPMDKTECRKQLNLALDQIHILYMDSNKGTRTQKRKDRYEETLTILKQQEHYENINSVELTTTPRELIPLYMNACDIHLLSSDFEGSPNSVKECLCCNTPVVSTDVGNVRDMIGDIEGCYVSQSFTAEELAKGVKYGLQYSQNNRFRGRELFLKKEYAIEIVAKKLSDLYKNISSPHKN